MSRNVFAMSDEELLNLDPSTLPMEAPAVEDEDKDEAAATDEASTQAAEETSGNEAEANATDATDAADEAPEPGAQATLEAADADDPSDATADDGAAEGTAQPVPEGKDDKGQAVDTKAEPKAEDKTEEVKAEEAAPDFEAEYKKLLAPFKANGKEIAVQSVDEAIQLMQMGANYNRKMAALKPNLKLLKLLESNQLLDETKISYLIDLANKDPKAINRLVADSGIDPMDLSAEKADEYRPTNRSVSDKELELDEVLGEIQESPTFQRTLSVVGKEWDAQSRQVVADAPQLLKVINGHVQTGIYDLIVAEVERERTFGRLKGMSDIEAYRQVGDAIQARGGFDHLASGTATPNTQRQQSPAPKTVVVPPKPAKADEDKLKEKRRAAGAAKPAAATSAPVEFNPLSMSDEEFSKMVQSKFL